MLTYKDFDSRNDFIDYLGLYHKDRHSQIPDFRLIHRIDTDCYKSELQSLRHNLTNIKNSWNNQSIDHIEQSVARHGVKQLEIMQGQKKDKLRAGYDSEQPMYRIKNCDADSFFYQLADDLGLERPLARYHIQFPGEVTAWHTDIYSPAHEFLAPLVNDTDETVGQDKNIRRILIALEQWDWGQLFLFGKTPWVNWQAGDVVYWNYGVPHSAANTGYTPRISVSITGLISTRFELKISNSHDI